MWGKEKDKRMAFNAAASNGTTLVSRDTEIIGDVHFSGDLEVQGVVKGNIVAKGGGAAVVRVIEGGRVEGEVRAPHVVVNGHIVGDVHAAEHIELAAKAQVEGNIHYQLIEMVKGAQLNGSLVYCGKPAPETRKVAAVATPAVSAGNS
jgi:cytoskeletal protein CcmA (bactofilin family)